MAISSTLRPSVLAARETLSLGREKLRQQHDAGSPGIQVCAKLTDLVDSIVVDLYESAFAELPAETAEHLQDRVALVAHGGYGRRHLSPYSDVDLMVLYSSSATAHVAPLAERINRDIMDSGFDLGQSVRTPSVAVSMARRDPVILSSLVESRLLVGSKELFNRYQSRLAHESSRRQNFHTVEMLKARRSERRQFGDTVYLLEPNVKRSHGGLRELQLLRWVGYCCYGTPDPASLKMLGALSAKEQDALRRATEMLLRIRNELHFNMGKSYDVLDRDEQVRLATLFGYEGSENLLPVEEFMRDYFRRTANVRHVVAHFVANTRRGSSVAGLLGYMFSHRVEGDYRVGPAHITATPLGEEKLKTDLGEILRLTDLANLYDKRISQPTWEVVRQAAVELPDTLDENAAARFLSLLSQPARLGDMLRRLHELAVLEKIIPGFRHARALLQFNQYHKYTVDEHCIRAVEKAADLINDDGTLGDVYRGIANKRMLHLALLLHDLGKGFTDDHSEVGLKIAQETSQRLRLSTHDAELVEFLVHQHLLLAQSALWRDSNDPQIVLNLAEAVGSPEVLRMLYVLTAADLAAVGPGVLNGWKLELLTSLYRRTMRHLAGATPASASPKWIEKRRDAVRLHLASAPDTPWFNKQIKNLPVNYLDAVSPEEVARQVRALHELPKGKAFAWGQHQPTLDAVEYVVGSHESITPGIFFRLAGALTSGGLTILSAEINTLADGIVLDRFYVSDPDYSAAPPEARLEEISQRLVESLEKPQDGMPRFRRVWNQEPVVKDPAGQQKVQVKIDNSTSEQFTIIDVFAPDQIGLLFTIARAVFELDLSIHRAKIGTHLDRVVDVFYVTEADNGKIEEEDRRREIREKLLAAIDKLGHENGD